MLTKVFVVLVTVLSLLTVALIVPLVVNMHEQTKQMQNAKDELAGAQNRARVAEASLNSARTANSQAIAELQAQVSKAAQDTTALQNQVTELTKDKVKLADDLTRSQYANDQLTAGYDQGQKIIADLQKEVTERRESTLDLQRRYAEVSSELQDKNIRLDDLVMQIRLFKEQQNDLQNEITRLQALVQGGSTAGTGASTQSNAMASPAVVVQGTITRVQEIGGETFIEMNVGTNDNVRDGMEFMIHKGGTYIGNAVVTRTDLNSSAARVTLKKGDIQPSLEVMHGGA